MKINFKDEFEDCKSYKYVIYRNFSEENDIATYNIKIETKNGILELVIEDFIKLLHNNDKEIAIDISSISKSSGKINSNKSKIYDKGIVKSKKVGSNYILLEFSGYKINRCLSIFLVYGSTYGLMKATDSDCNKYCK